MSEPRTEACRITNCPGIQPHPPHTPGLGPVTEEEHNSIRAASFSAEREAATPLLDVDEVIDALDAQAQLLACYRVGKHPSGKLLDRVGRANDLRARLAQQDGTGE